HEFAAVDGKSPFVQLLEVVHAIDGLERLRFTSPHPIGFRDDLLRALAELPQLAEHVHLPVQSGSDRILKAMHRPYTADKYRSLVRQIREARKEIAITTDVIVGFPGEEEDDYRRTRDLVEEIQFDNAFVFRYSTRQETPAASMPQIDERVKEERNQDLLEVVDASAQRINARLVGRHLEVLCEGPSRTNKFRLMGRTRTNKIVVFAGEPQRAGEIFDIHIEEATGFSLYGTPVMPPSSAFAYRSSLFCRSAFFSCCGSWMNSWPRALWGFFFYSRPNRFSTPRFSEMKTAVFSSRSLLTF